MIAYLFWHRLRRGATPARYEALLAAFHETLAAASTRGFLGSTCHRLDRLPWPATGDARRLGGPRVPRRRPGYEDRYFLEGSEGLDVLDRAAVTGPREEVHGALAALAGEGAGGLYRLRREGWSDEGRTAEGVWLTRPRGRPSGDFLDELERRVPRDAQIWQRQMVLGPAPEFGLVAPPGECPPAGLPGDWRAFAVQRRPVWPAPRDA